MNISNYMLSENLMCFDIVTAMDSNDVSVLSTCWECIVLSRLLRVTGYLGTIPERMPEKRQPRLRMAAGAKITQSPEVEVVTINDHRCLASG